MTKEYKSISEFINDLMDNEGSEFSDGYGRYWKYKDLKFFFMNLGENEFKEGLFCCHLYSTIFKIDQGF